MKTGLFHRIATAFRRQPPLHPIDRRMARHWIKQRLMVVFPELRNDPQALDAAYHALSLQPRPGSEEGDADTVFEMTIPGEN